MIRHLAVSLGLLLVSCSEPTPPVQDILEGTVIETPITYVVTGVDGTTTTYTSISVSTVAVLDINNPCNGLYSVHVQPTTPIAYSDAPAVPVTLSEIVRGTR